jgi:hypothetical protein
MRRLLFILMCLCLVSLSQATIVKIEAEEPAFYYIAGTNWETVEDVDDTPASGGFYITAITNSNPYTEETIRYYSIPIPAGTYNLYMRLYVDNSDRYNNDSMFCGNTFGETATMGTYNDVGALTTVDGVSVLSNYGWAQVNTGYVSTGGNQVFRLSPREDGLRVDAIVFATADEVLTDELLTNMEGLADPLKPYDPVVTPANEDGTVGTLEYVSQWQVSDLVLGFKAGKDETGTYAVNPDIAWHNVYLQYGLPSDANMLLVDTLPQSSLEDPIQSLGPLSDYAIVLVDNTTFQWQVEQVIRDPNGNPYPDNNSNNIWGSVWTFKTASAVPEIISISDEANTDANGNASLTIVVTPLGDHFQWFQVVGQQDTAENGETDDIKLLDSSPLYEGTTTATLQITGAAPDGSDDAQVYAIAYHGAPGGASTEVSAPSETRWFWYSRLMARYPFEALSGGAAPDVVSGYDMSLLSGDDGADVPGLNGNVPSASGLGSTKSLLFNNQSSSEPNMWAQYGLIAEPTIGRYRNITISFWAYHRGGLYNQKFIDFGTVISPGTTNNSMYITPRNNDNCLLFNVITQNITSPANAVPINEWIHIAATLRGDTARLYVNGQWVASGEITNDPISLGTTGTVNYVGRSTDPSDAYFNGHMDDLQIFNYGLTSEQVGQLYLADTDQDTLCDLEAYDLQDFDINGNCFFDLPDLLELISKWLDSDRIYPVL